MDKNLAAKVEAVNLSHSYAIELYPKLVEAMRPFVGQKVLKKGGELTEKVKGALPALPYNNRLKVTHSRFAFRLEWTVGAGVNTGEGYAYHDTGLYIGKVENGILTALDGTAPTHRTNYTVEEIEQGRETCRLLREQLRAAESDISMFGYY